MTNSANVIGQCGLGNMGFAVATRLATAGPVLAYDPSADRRIAADEIDGVTKTDSMESLRGLSSVVLSLPTPAISLTVCRQLSTILDDGALVIETSTATPADVLECAGVLNAKGIGLVDAAILSGVGLMAAGKSTLLVGGSRADLARAEHILEALAPNRQVFGELGAGSAAKVVNNAVAHAVMVVLVEAMAMSAASGIDLGMIAQILQSDDGGLVRPLTHRVMERVASADFDGGMPMEAARKDSVLALKMAQHYDLPLFAIQGAHTVYEIADRTGLRRLDYSALATLWEEWAGISLSYAQPTQR
ncbi:NAD(P)-dependent oxidoreductase [Mycobacterium deserti]|uniref:NAD(P)-binding domain-containing protein n=1 Tax=Mycobacterium deserti TaxID=2978347 RepID=A0ABT2MEK8_9MYCO|nr:NAD(P)-binding domain-containing protein [Mycobacterium deserti]MCT7660711.1 NAD(P)-binding domain-containing protein [Mycobacterium deserti]